MPKRYLSETLWLVGITYPTHLFGQGYPSLPKRTIIPGESDPHVARFDKTGITPKNSWITVPKRDENKLIVKANHPPGAATKECESP